jgi:hypothetical protein
MLHKELTFTTVTLYAVILANRSGKDAIMIYGLVYREIDIEITQTITQDINKRI